MGDRPHWMPATRQSWPNIQPLPEQRAELALGRVFTEHEYARIAAGLIPEQMEDKWFIFLEADTLYVHRSWTGYCIYQLRLSREGTDYRVVEAFANRDAGQYSGASVGYDEQLVLSLIENLLLRRPTPLPRPAGLPAGLQTELYHAHVIGAGVEAEQPPGHRRRRGCLWRWLIRRRR